MKRYILTIAFVCMAALSFAQNSSILRPRMEVAEVEQEAADGAISSSIEVFYMDDENPRMYYLSLGHLGIGTDIVQIGVDPFFELFIPLGGTLEEAIAKMEEIKDFYQAPKLSVMELEGSFAVAYPDKEIKTVILTRRQLLFTRVMEFSLPAGDDEMVRAVHISKSEFSSLLSSLKLYKRLHPTEL